MRRHVKMTPGLNYKVLQKHWRKGVRNDNLRKRNPLQKGFYMAAMGYAKVKGEIVNSLVVGKRMSIIEILVETRGMRILKRGFEKAVE